MEQDAQKVLALVGDLQCSFFLCFEARQGAVWLEKVLGWDVVRLGC